MMIYTCDVCLEVGRCCEVSTEQDDPLPKCCPYGGACAWQAAYRGAVR